MSVYACLVSRSLRVTLFVGKPLRQPGGSVTGFWRGDGFDADFAQALWRLVDEADDLVMTGEGMDDDEAAADLPDLGGDRGDGDLPYGTFLASRPAVRARYYAVVPADSTGRPAGGRHGTRPPVLERHRLTDPPAQWFVDGRWRPAGHAARSGRRPVEICERDAVAMALLALHDANPALVRHHARGSGPARRRAGPDGRPRFLYWATFYGGDRSRPVRVAYDIPGHGRGWYTRYEGDAPGSLLRYDRAVATGVGAGAVLYADGRWRHSESPERNVWLGSNHGEPVSVEQARGIAVEFGHPADVVDAEAVLRAT